MAEIALCWYSLDDTSIVATREQAALWAEELELPTRVLAMSATPANFSKSCDATTITYPGPDGSPRTAKAVALPKRPEVLTYEVRRDGVRLAQVKHFAARRTEAGEVSGSARVRTMVNKSLDEHDAAGVALWLETFTYAFEQTHSIVSWKVVRRIALTALLETATPIRGRKWLYFCYVDQLAPANRLREWLTRVCDDADVTVLPIENGADLTTFISSADADMNERVAAFNDRLVRHAGGRYLKRDSELCEGIAGIYRGLVARVEEHETRLSTQLSTTHSTLLHTRRLIRSADPTGHLLRVSTR